MAAHELRQSPVALWHVTVKLAPVKNLRNKHFGANWMGGSRCGSTQPIRGKLKRFCRDVKTEIDLDFAPLTGYASVQLVHAGAEHVLVYSLAVDREECCVAAEVNLEPKAVSSCPLHLRHRCGSIAPKYVPRTIPTPRVMVIATAVVIVRRCNAEFRRAKPKLRKGIITTICLHFDLVVSSRSAAIECRDS